MKTTKTTGLLALSLLLLAGCNGSSSGSPGTPPGGENPPPPPPPPGETRGNVDVALDAQGNAVPVAFASALAVNDANQIIGFAATETDGPFVAALWTADASGQMTGSPARLAPIAGNAFSAAFALDAAGNAVGQSQKETARVAVRWAAGESAPVELPALAAGNSAAYGVSADGTLVVGEAVNAIGLTRAVVWSSDAEGAFGAPLTLPLNIFTTPGAQPPFAAAHGVARVGDAIWVVGAVEDAAGVERAVLWRSTSGTSFIATSLHRDEVRTVANGVNGDGIVVGEAEIAGGVFVGSVWRLEDTGTELRRSPLGAPGAALAIDAAGRVSGWTGTTPSAAVWSLPGTSPARPISTSPSQAYGTNANRLVVGSQGSAGFVTRLP